MTHPDPRVAEALERTARHLADATQPPPTDLPEDPAAYLSWLRHRPPARSSARRERAQWLNPDPFRVRGPRSRVGPDERAPGYAKASETLRHLPDLGAASLEAARRRHGDLPYEQLVQHAAAHLITVQRRDRTALNSTEHPRPAASECEACGTALDPDHTCHTCTETT